MRRAAWREPCAPGVRRCWPTRTASAPAADIRSKTGCCPCSTSRTPSTSALWRKLQLAAAAGFSPLSHLPAEIRDDRDPYGFIGRDGPILEMERALHRKAPAILVQGLGGVGKTTLARGFLRWLDDTGGLDGAQWFDFRDIRTAEYVINRTGEEFYGENFRLAPKKLALLADALGERRVVMVWDNFESAAANLTAEDRAELGRFLDAIRGKRGKVIVTSRSREEWLKPEWRFELPLPGLDGEERWEYCETILRELGLKVNRNDPELSKLMNDLRGHPLAMRAVLPKLETMPAAKIAEALRTNIAELWLNEQEEQGRLFAALRFVEQGLAEELRSLLGLVGLHEGYITAALLELMAKQVDVGWTRQRIDRLMEALVAAGLLRNTGQATFEMHPLLTSYLRSRGEANEPCQRAFVDVMKDLAGALALQHSTSNAIRLCDITRTSISPWRLPNGYRWVSISVRLLGASPALRLTSATSTRPPGWALGCRETMRREVAPRRGLRPITNWAGSPRSSGILRWHGIGTSNPSPSGGRRASRRTPPQPITSSA